MTSVPAAPQGPRLSDTFATLPSSLPAGLELGRDLPTVLGVVGLVVLLALVVMPLRRRRRGGRPASVNGDAGSAGGAGADARSMPARPANVHRPPRELLFADRDGEVDPLAEDLRTASGPREVLDVLQRLAVLDPEPPSPPVGRPPRPPRPPGPEPAVPPSAPSAARTTPARPREVPPAAWLVVGGLAALLIARRGRRSGG